MNGNLILSRKQGQSIRIGDATVTVSKVKGNRVTIAVQAPKETRIVRGELERKAARRCAFDYARVVAGELLEGCDWSDSMPPNLDEALEWLAEHNCGRTKSESVPEGFNLDDWPHGAVEFVKAIPGIVATLTEDEESIA
jgi:carbon storage regulator CsrA